VSDDVEPFEQFPEDHSASPDEPDFFFVQVCKYVDGTNSFKIRFGVDDSYPEVIDQEGDEKPDGTEKPFEVPKIDKISATRQLSVLSRQWTETAIAFFEAMPKLTAESFRFASNELFHKVSNYLRESSLKQEVFDDGETTISEYKMSIDELPIVATKMGKSTHAIQAANVLGRSSLGALVSEYESLMARLLNIISKIQPGAFVTSDDQISVGELTRYESIEAAKNALISRKIEDLLHSKSHVEVLNWIAEKFGVNLTSDIKLLAGFTEICQRRHLLTHAGGMVNERYLSICSRAGCNMDPLPKLGERVPVNSEYLRSATARVYQVGFFTLHILWQKLVPKDVEVSYSSVLTASHDFLENGLTKMCLRLCDFVLKGPKRPSERVHAYLTINKALSFLNDESTSAEQRDRDVKSVLNSRDWSVVSPTLALALACIRGEFEELEKLTVAAQADGVTYLEANTWVVFKRIRDRPEFMEKFRRISKQA
jgi:hypothetical protein